MFLILGYLYGIEKFAIPLSGQLTFAYKHVVQLYESYENENALVEVDKALDKSAENLLKGTNNNHQD